MPKGIIVGYFAIDLLWCYINLASWFSRLGRKMYQSGVFKIWRDSLSVARVILKEKGILHAVWYLCSFRTRGFGRFLFDCYSVLYSRACNKPLIHMIGDSHVKMFRGNRLFVVHHIGAATAHNLGKPNSATNSNRKLFNIIDKISRKDIVVLVFGEIDCRVHIYYQYKKNNERRAIGELIDGTISNYGRVLEELRGAGIKFLVYGVPPATKVRDEYRYPFYAPPEIHGQINRTFNERLKEFCEETGYEYIDVHSRFSDESGFMLREYAADEIHLNGRVVDFVKGELNERLGINI